MASRLPGWWSLSARTLSRIGLCPDRRYGDDLLWVVMWEFFFYYVPLVVGIPTARVRQTWHVLPPIVGAGSKPAQNLATQNTLPPNLPGLRRGIP